IVARADPQADVRIIVTLLVSLVATTLIYATLMTLRTWLEELRDARQEMELTVPQPVDEPAYA
ncbi:MAG: hypothetical protein HW416_3789, partial [Chloroflexi bacterium]|nr:hypothetical protein [Chloroflexota bacterium]